MMIRAAIVVTAVVMTMIVVTAIVMSAIRTTTWAATVAVRAAVSIMAALLMPWLSRRAISLRNSGEQGACRKDGH
jgi:hypothetical protein